MGKKKIVELNEAQRTELEKGYRTGKNHSFRLRCQMILLKVDKRTSLEVAEILDCCEVVVNNWLKRYLAQGINGLETRAERGRPKNRFLRGEDSKKIFPVLVTAAGKTLLQKYLDRFRQNLYYY